MIKKELPMIDHKISELIPNKLSDSALTKDKVTNTINDAIDSGDDAALRKILGRLHYADLADYINFSSYEKKKKILTLAKNKLDPEIFLEFEIDILSSVVEILGNKDFAALVGTLPIVEALQILVEFKPEDTHKIIPFLPLKKRKTIKQALAYPKNCAGMLMVRRYASVKATQTVGVVLSYLL
jgi:magnesium transporter